MNSVEEIVGNVKTKGIHIIPNYMGEKELEIFTRESDAIFADMKDGQAYYAPDNIFEDDGYCTGKNVRLMPPSYDRISETIKVWKNDIFLNAIVDDFYGPRNSKRMQIFFTNEYKVASEFPEYVRSGNLHVDGYQALKFIVYLKDCERKNGAFRYHEGTPGIGREYRGRYTVDQLCNQGKYRIDSDPELWSRFNDENCSYAEAPAGSLLIFDTDTLHAGGLIEEEGLERRTIIVHNRRG